MVKFIPATLTLPLRSIELRNGRPLNECVFPTDEVEGAFHLAYQMGDEIATIASFFPNSYQNATEIGYQLRGMATAEKFKGKGFASELLKYAVSHLKSAGATHIWCNARTSAAGFYQKLDFETKSAMFEIPSVGPHYEMYLKI